MKFIVTGGLGFIGINLVHRLIRDDHQVFIVDNLSSRGRLMGFENPLVKETIGDIKLIPSRKLSYKYHSGVIVIGDVAEKDTWSSLPLCSDVEGIFHIAGRLGNEASLKDPSADARTNIFGTIKTLDFALENHINKFVITNSICSWESQEDGVLFTETKGVIPESPYGLSKLVCGEYALLYHRLFGLQVSVAKLFNIYGPGDTVGDNNANVIPLWITKASRDEDLIVTGPDGIRDYIYVDDVVEILLRAMDTPTNCMFNVGSGEGCNSLDLAKMIKEAVGSSSKITIGEPRKWDAINHRVADISLMKELLRYHPETPIDVGIDDTVYWWDLFKILGRNMI